jgi:hypothetical protein
MKIVGKAVGKAHSKTSDETTNISIQFDPIQDVKLRHRRLSQLFIMFRMHWPQNYFNRFTSLLAAIDCDLPY